MRAFGLLLAMLSFLAAPFAAANEKEHIYRYPTMWLPVHQSLTELLNEGWRIAGFNDYETETHTNNHVAYTFVLTNGKKPYPLLPA